MERSQQWRMETLAVQGGYEPEEGAYPCVPPIVQSSAFQFESAKHAAELFLLEREGNVYTRIMNPTNDVLERRMAAMEGGVGALATSSGQAAAALTLMTLCRAGDEVVVSTSLYGGIFNLFRNTIKHMGITPRFVAPTDTEGFRRAINDKTRLVYAEALGNPKLDTPDIAALGEIAHAHNLPFVLDNTIPTSVLLQPFEFGVDISIYSTTKYVCGHGNAMGGMIIDSGRFDWSRGPFPSLNEPDVSNSNIVYTNAFGPQAFIIGCRAQLMREIGACASPFNSYLMIVGLETLPLRMERHCRSAEQIAAFLAEHPKVSWVGYPGRTDHPTHANAAKYLRGGFSGMVAFGVRDGLEAGRRFVDNIRLCRHAANLGDARSLVVHPASTTHSQMSSEDRQRAGIGDDLIRLSVGLEHPEDIMADIDQALGGR